MMFVASKVLAFAIEPLYWVLLFLAVGLLVWPYRPRLGRTLAWTSLAGLLLSGWVFIPNQLLRSLESRYPRLPADTELQQYVGVVVLGGALADSQLWVEHKQVALNNQAGRMTAAVGLMQRYPHLKVVFSGGIASVGGIGVTESQLARAFFDDMGVPPARVMYEGSSRNTYENGYFSSMMPGVDKRKPWLLLTSSFHMPRAIGVFEKLGWNITAYPVDYRTTSNGSWYDFSLHFGPNQWELALHEMLGYYVYKTADMI